LDPDPEGAVLVGRLRRGARGDRQGETAPLGDSGPDQLLDYFYYAALTVAAVCENASAREQQEWRELLTAHQEQLREWAENYSPTFADKHARVSAEIARLEGRDAEAMRLYEQTIRSAHDQGFVQNEALAREIAARFYAARGVGEIAHFYLRGARNCYLRWGAHGKVRQLDECYPFAGGEGPDLRRRHDWRACRAAGR
jgi:hypothetical protein